MRKILFIIPSNDIGGINSSLQSMLTHLALTFDVEVLTMSSSGSGQYELSGRRYKDVLLDAYYTNFDELSGCIKVVSIMVKIFKRIFLLLNLNIEQFIHKYVANKYQKCHRYDVVVGFSEGRATKLASWFKSVKRIAWIHCDYDRAIPLEVDETQLYKRFQQIICVSKYTKDMFLKRYPSLADITNYIYNLIDINRINSLSMQKPNDYRFNNNNFTIISVGRMDPVKRFTIIPKIAKYLLINKCEFIWYIIGGPSNEEYLRVKHEINKYNVEDNVILLGPMSNPYPYFKNADLYVATSISEACPMVFNEAMVCGVPVLSSDFGSAQEFIVEEQNGYVVPIELMAKMLCKIIDERNLYDDLRNNCTNIDLNVINQLAIDKIDCLFSV